MQVEVGRRVSSDLLYTFGPAPFVEVAGPKCF